MDRTHLIPSAIACQDEIFECGIDQYEHYQAHGDGSKGGGGAPVVLVVTALGKELVELEVVEGLEEVEGTPLPPALVTEARVVVEGVEGKEGQLVARAMEGVVEKVVVVETVAIVASKQCFNIVNHLLYPE